MWLFVKDEKSRFQLWIEQGWCWLLPLFQYLKSFFVQFLVFQARGFRLWRGGWQYGIAGIILAHGDFQAVLQVRHPGFWIVRIHAVGEGHIVCGEQPAFIQMCELEFIVTQKMHFFGGQKHPGYQCGSGQQALGNHPDTVGRRGENNGRHHSDIP